MKDSECRMSPKLMRLSRWLVLIGSGTVLFQAADCATINQFAQTGLLGAIAGGLLYLARNV